MGQIVYTSGDDTKESSIRVRLKSDGKEYNYQHADVKTETGLCGLYVVYLSLVIVIFFFRCFNSMTYRYDLAAKHLVRQKCTFMTLTSLKTTPTHILTSQVSTWESQTSTAQSYRRSYVVVFEHEAREYK